MTQKQAEDISNRDELAQMPDEYTWRLSIRTSPIHGKGLFLSFKAGAGEVIAPATVDGLRTIAGKYVNHSANPNCVYKMVNGEVLLVSVAPISGSFGGFAGDELTVDYRQSVNLSMENLQ